MRTNQHVATLIQTLEPYVPSLHRDASKDRYRISILLSPLDGRSAGRLITIAEGLSTGQFVLPRILGSDGRTLWFDVVGIGGIDVTTFHVVRAEAFQKANPTLDPIWWEDARGMEVVARLRSTSRDQSRAMEFDPVTLKSSAVDVVRNSSQSPFPMRTSQLLAAGVFVSPTSWLGLQSSAEADREFFPKSRVKRIVEATDAKVLRRVYRGTLRADSSGGRHEIVSMSAVGTDEYLNAAFLRLEESAESLRLRAPDGYLMIYTAKPGLGGTLVVARVDTNGATLWKADTGIDRFLLSQILPGEGSVAFVGPRPQVPGKVSEPLLVVVESGTGAVRVSSLWK